MGIICVQLNFFDSSIEHIVDKFGWANKDNLCEIGNDQIAVIETYEVINRSGSTAASQFYREILSKKVTGLIDA